MLLGLLTVAVGLSCAAGLHAQPAVSATSRMVARDGTYEVTFPCKESDVIKVSADSLMACIANGIVYGAGQFQPAATAGSKPQNLSYDDALQLVRANLGAENVKETMISGHRAFQYLCPNNDGQPCKLVIDMAPRLPVMLTGGDNPKGTATREAWHRISPEVASFFASFRVVSR